jgi:hypothetical protein
VVKQLFEIDLTGATDITDLTGKAAAAKAVGKTPFLDIKAVLNANGFSDTQIPAKIEGLAFGQDVTLNGVIEHTLYVTNDNDFVADVAGPNQFFVFGFTDSDLPGFVQQQLVPEPSALTLLGAGLLLGFGIMHCRSRERARFAAVRLNGISHSRRQRTAPRYTCSSGESVAETPRATR